jgi:uncharacterized protein with PIN domain
MLCHSLSAEKVKNCVAYFKNDFLLSQVFFRCEQCERSIETEKREETEAKNEIFL